jgi:hypothetical protein
MRTISVVSGLAMMLAAAMPTAAETMRSKVAFNTGIQKQAPTQPAGGIAKTWDVTLSDGELDGCTASIVDNGSWGTFELEATVTCAKGAFKLNTSGAWDQNGFHGGGAVSEDGRTGDFAQLEGRVAQIGARLVPGKEAGTLDVTYDLVIDRETK